jgi:hypothetical protein
MKYLIHIVSILIVTIVFVCIFFKKIENFHENFDKNYEKQEIVIARYNEKLEWINQEPFNRHPIIVYNKSDNENFSKNNVKKIVNLPNVGRETHSYLYHIIENYDNLSDITIFLPGSADFHNKFDRSKNLVTTVENTNKTVFSCAKDEKFIENNYNFQIDDYLSTDENNKKINNDSSMKISDIRPFGKWYESIFPNEKNDCISWGSIIAVSKENILQKPKSYYENIIKELNTHHNPETGHYMERSWYAVFYPYTDAIFI